MPFHQPDQFVQALLAAVIPVRAAVAIGRGRGQGVEQERAVGFVEEVDAPHGHRAQGVAVVALLELEEASFFPAPLMMPVLVGYFQGRLNCGGAVVGIEDLVEAVRGDFRQAAGQDDGRGVGQAQKGAVRDILQLGHQGAVQFLPPVAVDIAPQGGDPVQVAAAVLVEEVGTLSPGDDEQFFGNKGLHLGEGMPEVVPVPAGQGVVVIGHGGLLEG